MLADVCDHGVESVRVVDQSVLSRDTLGGWRELGHQRLETQFRAEREAALAVGALVAVAVWFIGHWHVGTDLDQRAALVRIVGVFGQRGPILLLGKLGGGFEQTVQRLVSRDELASAFFPNARHSLHVVAGIAHQRQHVDHLVRPDPELLHDTSGVVPNTLVTRVEHLNLIVHQLEEVLVAGDQHHLQTVRSGPSGEGADDIVRLDSLVSHDRYAEGCARLVDPRHLFDEVVRHRLSVSLVVGREFVPERRTPQVERRRDQGGLVVVQQLP